MIRAATAYATNRLAEEAASLAVSAALEKAGIRRADIVIFFASPKYRRSYESILKKIKQLSGAKSIVGASGFGILTEEIEIERQAGIAVMVIASDCIDAESFLIENLQESNFIAGQSMAKILRTRQQNNLVFIFPDALSFQSPPFFDGFESHYGYVPMVGGAAAEEGRDPKTYQMEGERVTFDAVSGLVLGGNFRSETGIARSCLPFGEPFKITRAEGNLIYEMDGRPAYDILLESISQIDFKNPDQIFQRVFLGVPLKHFQTDFSEGPYLIRNIMSANAKKGMLTCISPIEEGEFVTFAVRDPQLARQNFQAVLEDIRDRLAPAQPALGFYFNCCARGEMLYDKPNEDINLIRQFFPNVPVLGFFTYGEIAPIDHVNHLHHHSGVLVMLAENP